MVVDQSNTIVHMSADEELTYGLTSPKTEPVEDSIYDPEIDDELGLEIVVVQTIFQKYGVHCDPSKNSFYASLHRQFEKSGSLSVKQVNALRK